MNPACIHPANGRAPIRSKCRRRIGILLFVIAASDLRAQGPPFQIDDPVPVDLHHYEFYIFGSMAGTPAEVDSTGPAFEFNWGALPRLQIHAILPLGAVAPSNNPITGLAVEGAGALIGHGVKVGLMRGGSKGGAE